MSSVDTADGSLVERAVRNLSRVAAALSGITMLLMTIIVFIDVTSRQFGGRLPGAFETVESLMAIVAYFSLAYVQRSRGHVAITVFTRRLPASIKSLLDAFGCLLGLFIAFYLMRWTFDQAVTATQLADYRIGLIRVPTWPYRWALPFAFALFLAELLFSLIRDLRTAFASRGADAPGDGPPV